jgi:hypothetical protein
VRVADVLVHDARPDVGDLGALGEPAPTPPARSTPACPGPDDLAVCAFSVFGPRNRVDKITRKLTLLP